MKRILINATHNEEIRVALCKDNHLYDFDLENRTREQKKANIYKGHITRVEPSLEAAFVEYGSARQGFLPLREIAGEYLHGNVREDNIKQLIKEGDEVIVQVEKEERGNKGAALSTYISLAGRYLVLMPNNAKAGGISRQISGKVREEMKQIIAGLNLPKGMSVIVRTAGLGKGAEDLQNDLDHLLDIWKSIQEQNKTRPSPCLVHQEAGVVTRAVRDYLRDDIGEVWIDSENAYNEAANFISAVMPAQMSKLRKYTDYEPMFARFGIERQIETAYQREVRLPSGGSIVIDQTEALVSIDINSSKSTKGSDVAETAYHTNLEAADEIARQLRLRDMGGLIVIDFIDMNDPRHQKEVEKRLVDATRHDRARVQFAEISKFGLMQMSRQRLRPSLEEATGYICPRCHGNGMIRDLRSLSLSIMRQIEQIALKERMGEIQAEVPTDIAAFLLNEKRESLVYLEQDSGTRITILPHAHLESPNFSLHFNPDGFAPSSYERIADTEEKENIDRGYEVNWQTDNEKQDNNRWHKPAKTASKTTEQVQQPQQTQAEPQAVAWLSNLFAPKPQARLAGSLGTTDAALAIESLVNGGNVSLGASGNINALISNAVAQPEQHSEEKRHKKSRTAKKSSDDDVVATPEKSEKRTKKDATKDKEYPKREAGVRRESRGEIVRGEAIKPFDKAEQAEKSEKTARTDKPKADKTLRQKSTNPDDVIMHISGNEAAKPASQVVHLSLDGSKAKTTNKATKPQAVADDNAVSTASQSQPASVVQSDTASVIADDSDKNSVASHDNPPSKATDAPLPNVAAISSALLEKITALAKQQNKAPNDPRVVAQAMQATEQSITGTAGEFIARTLGQTASGEFIADFVAAVGKVRRLDTAFDFSNFGYLPLTAAAKAQFDEQINATGHLSAAQGKTTVEPRPVARRASNDPRGQHPDFVAKNDHLSDDAPDIDSALAPMEAVASVSETAEARLEALDDTATGDYQNQEETKPSELIHTADDKTADDATTLEATKGVSIEADNNAPTTLLDDALATATSITEQLSETVGKVISDTIDEIGNIVSMSEDLFSHLDEQTDTQAAEHQPDEQAPLDITNTADKTAKDSTTGESKTTSKSKKGSQVKQITAEQKSEKKSKAASYKDMIENVAGQLQPQLGILNLMTTKTPKTPKAPKARTPRKPSKKPKVEVRKISKASETADTAESGNE
ncbi:Rne/Rng family ribonuclease [Moraxella cuniculi]|uniref:Ribonuclease E n=1 Tax=Moraxella cuniculi TaxID=34061 RepID=A0A3S5EFT0_9GAMM|nr:Rne/Rng family ribonuclease [Moraxella cuniculi]VEG12293.1 Ribonuclease E [Moraxella cuniculi]